MAAGIYLLAGRYVGRSRALETRLAQHRNALRRGDHYCRRLQHWWTKHGRPDPTFEILEPCPEVESVLIEREQHWMDRLRAEGRELWNWATAATGGHGPHTPESRAKIAAAHRGKIQGPHAVAHRRKIAGALRKTLRDPAKRKAMSDRAGASWSAARRRAQGERVEALWQDARGSEWRAERRRRAGDAEWLRTMREASRAGWSARTPEQRERHRQAAAEGARRRYERPEEREAAAERSRALANDPRWLEATTDGARRRSADPAWRARVSAAAEAAWADPEVRERRLAGMRAARDRRRKARPEPEEGEEEPDDPSDPLDVARRAFLEVLRACGRRWHPPRPLPANVIPLTSRRR